MFCFSITALAIGIVLAATPPRPLPDRQTRDVLAGGLLVAGLGALGICLPLFR